MQVTATGGRQALLSLLARQSRAGDRRAFEQLVVETSAEVYSLALRLVGNEHDARDVVQDAYLRAFRSIDRFRGESSVSTWLYRITANCAATQLRRRTRDAHDNYDDVHLREGHRERLPEEMAHHGDDRRVLVAALRELPSDLRAVVVLHDIYDLTHEAIATELKISRAASKVRLHRARRRLREALFVAGSELDTDRSGTLIALRPSTPADSADARSQRRSGEGERRAHAG